MRRAPRDKQAIDRDDPVLARLKDIADNDPELFLELLGLALADDDATGTVASAAHESRKATET